MVTYFRRRSGSLTWAYLHFAESDSWMRTMMTTFVEGETWVGRSRFRTTSRRRCDHAPARTKADMHQVEFNSDSELDEEHYDEKTLRKMHDNENFGQLKPHDIHPNRLDRKSSMPN